MGQAKKKTPKTKIIEGTDIIVPTRLPRPRKGHNLAVSTKIKLATYVCRMYATDLFTFDQSLAYFGIKSHATFLAWKKEIDAINDLFKDAVKEKDSRYFMTLKQRARTGLEKALNGHTIYLKEEKTVNPIENKNKTDIKIVTETKTKEVYIRPSVQAMIFVLSNQDAGNFAKNPEPEKEIIKTNELDHWTGDQLDDEIKRLEEDGY